MSTERSTSTMTTMTMEPAELGESPKHKFTNTFLNVVFYIFAASYKAHRRISTKRVGQR
jgi:hypothetical protein